MKSATALLFLIMFIISCNQKTTDDSNNDFKDSIAGMTLYEWKEHFKDSLMKKVNQDIAEKSINTQNDCPLKITKSWITHNSIGTSEANINIKNNSDKTVDALKVGILCYNNFDEPITESISGANQYMGISQSKLRPNKTETDTWVMYLFDNTTKIKPYIYQVHFTDGTIWQSK